MKQRYTIRALARKRFVLGYPPRKKDDTSIGDAINWEWVVQCAINEKRNVVIVSRDGDYGVQHDGEMVINDWLAQEFRARVSKRRKVVLTDRLSEAMKLAAVPVSQKAVAAENELIEEVEKRADSSAFRRPEFLLTGHWNGGAFPETGLYTEYFMKRNQAEHAFRNFLIDTTRNEPEKGK